MYIKNTNGGDDIRYISNAYDLQIYPKNTKIPISKTQKYSTKYLNYKDPIITDYYFICFVDKIDDKHFVTKNNIDLQNPKIAIKINFALPTSSCYFYYLAVIILEDDEYHIICCSSHIYLTKSQKETILNKIMGKIKGT